MRVHVEKNADQLAPGDVWGDALRVVAGVQVSGGKVHVDLLPAPGLLEDPDADPGRAVRTRYILPADLTLEVWSPTGRPEGVDVLEAAAVELEDRAGRHVRRHRTAANVAATAADRLERAADCAADAVRCGDLDPCDRAALRRWVARHLAREGVVLQPADWSALVRDLTDALYVPLVGAARDRRRQGVR